MDLTFKTPEGNFNHRTVGIFIHEGKVLVMQDDNLSYAYLPGGRISLHESSEEAIRREMREELETEVTVERLLWIAESFFTESKSGKRFHEVAFYYLLQPSDDLLQRGEPLNSRKGKSTTLSSAWSALRNCRPLISSRRC